MHVCTFPCVCCVLRAPHTPTPCNLYLYRKVNIFFKLLLPGTLAGYPAYVLHTSTHSTSYYQHKQMPFKDLKRTLVVILQEVVCTTQARAETKKRESREKKMRNTERKKKQYNTPNNHQPTRTWCSPCNFRLSSSWCGVKLKEGIFHMFINFHNRSFVATTITIIGCTK